MVLALALTSAQHLAARAGWNQQMPVSTSSVCMTYRNSMARHVTSTFELEQGVCVIQIHWTKACCDNCQPMPQIIVNKSDIYEADSCT